MNIGIGLEEKEKNHIARLKNLKRQLLMDEVRKNTIDFANNIKLLEEDNDRVILWQIVGINFKKDEIIKRYGEDIYNSVCRVYSTKAKKIGHLIHEGVCATKLMDLNLLVKLLAEKDISSYIDFENNTFYYNGNPKKYKKRLK